MTEVPILTPSPALQTRDLRVSAGAQPLLHGVQVQVPAQRWTAVVGPNGAGKSTLLRALAGLQPRKAWQGQLDLLGRPLAAWSGRQRARTLSWMGQNEAVAQELWQERDSLLAGDRFRGRRLFVTVLVADIAGTVQRRATLGFQAERTIVPPRDLARETAK
jgi:iron complex transport system ATP-binding protein